MSEWNSIKDRMPEHSGYYLVIRKSQGDWCIPEIALFDREAGYWVTTTMYKSLGKIKYWLQLPANPESEDN